MFKKTLVTLALSSSILLLSCDENPSNSTRTTTSPEIVKDLQKIASAVDNLGMLDNNKKQDLALQKSKAVVEDISCSSLGTGIEVCTYAFEDEYSVDTSYSYEMDGVTLRDIDDLDGPYKQSIRSHFSSPNYRGVGIFNAVIEFSSVSVEDYDFKVSMDGTATIDYFNDDLVLNFSKVSCNVNNETSSYDYRFTMFDGKYSVAMAGTMSYESIDDEPADTDVVASGPIVLVATGEIVGKFNMLYSCDVQILDNDGNIVKKTN